MMPPVLSVLRLNMTLPGLDPDRLSEMYAAALDMAKFADANGFTAVTTDEHHGADDGWMPATLVFTGMLAARTHSGKVTVQALLLPLHDPLRVAEDLAVLDLASATRGHPRPRLPGRGVRRPPQGLGERGRLMDEAVEALLKAWPGKPFEYHGASVKVTPTPGTKPHPPVMIGGSGRPGARRAAAGSASLRRRVPARARGLLLRAVRAARHDGFVLSPAADIALVFVAEDPNTRGPRWATISSTRRRRTPGGRRPTSSRRCTRTRRPSTSCAPRASTRSYRPTTAGREQLSGATTRRAPPVVRRHARRSGVGVRAPLRRFGRGFYA